MNNNMYKRLNIIFLIGILLISFVISFKVFTIKVAEGQLPQTKEEMDKLKLEGSIPTTTGPEAEPLETPTPPVTIYKFETGIPGVVKKGEGLQQKTVPELIKKIIYYVMRISGILAFVMILWGGIEYMTSAGNPKKQQEALTKIYGAVIGLILLFAFWLILNTINPDILKTPSLPTYEQTKNGDDTENNDMEDNIVLPDEASQLAQKILNQSNIKLYKGADADLQDVMSGRPIDVKKNDPHSDYTFNCNDQVSSFAKTINPNLLKAVLTLTSFRILGENCSSNYEVGPFISNHNYCINPNSAHKDGTAVDIALIGTKKSTQECTRALLLSLCPQVNTSDCPLKFICTATIGGVTIGIVNETCDPDPNNTHLHIQIP